MSAVGVIGAGSFGTALAKLLAEAGHDVTLWCRNPELARTITARRENPTYLAGVALPATLAVTTDVAAAAARKDVLLSVCPSHAVRAVMTEVLRYGRRDAYVVSASKGIEEESLQTMAGVLESLLGATGGHRVAALSGPSFAREVASGLPTAVTVAARSAEVSETLRGVFGTQAFRVYSSEDVVGVEIGGAVKNVIALAAGVSDGLGFGSNTRAALITRGLAEMGRLAARMGAHALTLSGLSGLGDLVLTCTGDLSRNRTVGLRLGKGESLDAIVGDMRMVAEGVRNARSVRALALKMGVEMPITEQIHALLYEAKSPRQVVQTLMQRDPKPELDRG